MIAEDFNVKGLRSFTNREINASIVACLVEIGVLALEVVSAEVGKGSDVQGAQRILGEKHCRAPSVPFVEELVAC